MFYEAGPITHAPTVSENMKFLDKVKPGALLQTKVPETIYDHPMFFGVKDYKKSPGTPPASMASGVSPALLPAAETMMVLSKEKVGSKVDVKVLYKGEVKYITLFLDSAGLHRFFKIL